MEFRSLIHILVNINRDEVQYPIILVAVEQVGRIVEHDKPGLRLPDRVAQKPERQ